MKTLLLMLLSFGTSDAQVVEPTPSDVAKPVPNEVAKPGPTAEDWAAKESQTVRAFAGPPNLKFPVETHRLTPVSVAGDYNLYPADNGIVLQGIANGPIGNHESASFWVTGVHDPNVENGPSHLEAVLVYSVDCDDCPGEKEVVVRIDSVQATPEKPADLLRIKSMKIHDLQKNGSFEVILDARFRPCCEGMETRSPYSEIIILKIEDEKIERWTEAEQRRRPN